MRSLRPGIYHVASVCLCAFLCGCVWLFVVAGGRRGPSKETWVWTDDHDDARAGEKAREEEMQGAARPIIGQNIFGPLCASYAALPAQKEI